LRAPVRYGHDTAHVGPVEGAVIEPLNATFNKFLRTVQRSLGNIDRTCKVACKHAATFHQHFKGCSIHDPGSVR